MSRRLSIAVAVALANSSLFLWTPTFAADPTCVKILTVDENMLDVYKTRFANDKCKLVKTATATRIAMLNEIHSRPNNCGLPPRTVAILEEQRVKFLRTQAEVCR